MKSILRSFPSHILPIISAVSLVSLLLVACGGGGSRIAPPRERVLEFVKEVQADTLPDISKYLDFDSVATYEYSEAKYDTLSLMAKKEQLVRDFTGKGAYMTSWRNAQIVVSNQKIEDDTTAVVDVSFIDRSTRVQYVSKMRLKKRNNWWLITDFRANQPH